MSKIRLCVIALCCCLTSFTLAAEAPAPVVKLCMNCHGKDGNSESPMFPRLAGQQAAYIENQLHAYRDQSRINLAAQRYMWGMARVLSDDDIKQIADWFAAQRPSIQADPAAPAAQQLGAQIFHHGLPDKGIPACASCHGAQAEGSAIAPRLAGQHAHYVADQLQVLSSNERPAATLMQPIAKQLGEQEIAALASYVQSLN